MSISYLGLTRERAAAGKREPGWQSWYRYFPWEDWRGGPPKLLARAILPRLAKWIDEAREPALKRARRQRVDSHFAEPAWNEELVLQRYELLYEAGLVPEAGRPRKPVADPLPGEPMRYDHRRILATGIARLRAKIKYRPVVFELMPPDFTLGQLQRAVEALAGRRLHKQNFRRLIEQQGLVEETGAHHRGNRRPAGQALSVSAARSCSNAPSPAPSSRSPARPEAQSDQENLTLRSRATRGVSKAEPSCVATLRDGRARPPQGEAGVDGRYAQV